MNAKDNKRHQETIQQVYATFSELLREQELNEISVTELCESANIERSTFLEMVSIPSPNCGLKTVVLIPHKRWEKSSKESM